MDTKNLIFELRKEVLLHLGIIDIWYSEQDIKNCLKEPSILASMNVIEDLRWDAANRLEHMMEQISEASWEKEYWRDISIEQSRYL